MAVEYLGIDFTTRRELHRDPTWEAALTAIDLLDGANVHTVRLSTRAGTSMSIDGGEAGRYVVKGIRCSGFGTSLMDPAGAAADIGLFEGRPARPETVVTKEIVLRAAALFFRNGSFDAALSWGAAPASRLVGACDA